jgi:hypothetical protein
MLLNAALARRVTWHLADFFVCQLSQDFLPAQLERHDEGAHAPGQQEDGQAPGYSVPCVDHMKNLRIV